MAGVLYARVGDAWVEVSGGGGGASGAGATGATGPSGASGASGPSGPSGVSGPVGATGVTGPVGPSIFLEGTVPSAPADLPPGGPTNPGGGYIDQGTGDFWVWDGSQWVNAGPIQGPTGAPGTTGPTGATGPTVVSADAGNAAVLGTDSFIYVPSTVGNEVAIDLVDPTIADPTTPYELWYDPDATPTISGGGFDQADADLLYVKIPGDTMTGPLIINTGITDDQFTIRDPLQTTVNFEVGGVLTGELRSYPEGGGYLMPSPNAVFNFVIESWTPLSMSKTAVTTQVPVVINTAVGPSIQIQEAGVVKGVIETAGNDLVLRAPADSVSLYGSYGISFWPGGVTTGSPPCEMGPAAFDVRYPLSVGVTGAPWLYVDATAVTTRVPVVLPLDPVLPMEAATKQYVDAASPTASGYKEPARAATTANVVLTGLQTIDGIVLAEGDRVLVKVQTVPTENGIYTASAGAWTRTPDADTNEKLFGATVPVPAGTAANNTMWMNGSNLAADIGTLGAAFYPVNDGLYNTRFVDIVGDTMSGALRIDTGAAAAPYHIELGGATQSAISFGAAGAQAGMLTATAAGLEITGTPELINNAQVRFWNLAVNGTLTCADPIAVKASGASSGVFYANGLNVPTGGTWILNSVKGAANEGVLEAAVFNGTTGTAAAFRTTDGATATPGLWINGLLDAGNITDRTPLAAEAPTALDPAEVTAMFDTLQPVAFQRTVPRGKTFDPTAEDPFGTLVDETMDPPPMPRIGLTVDTVAAAGFDGLVTGTNGDTAWSVPGVVALLVSEVKRLNTEIETLKGQVP